MNELPVGTTFREAIYLASTTSNEQSSFYETSPRERIERKFATLKRRYGFTVVWRELKSPVPFPRSWLSNFVQNTITTEGNH